MVNSKKLLSLFLAVVMVFSALTIMASAYTRVETEGTADIDLKYTVEKVAVLPETAAGSAELAGDNFYAVTVWMKSAKPIDTLIVPFHYNKAHFSAITLSDGEVTYPYGAGLDQDSYFSDMGEGANYLYTLGDYMNNTGMYKANGTAATTKALAKCIGLGNENSEGVSILSELVSPDHTLYNKWGAGLPANTGVMYAQIDCATKTKTAYLNTIEGVTTSTDWNRMLTVYFESITDEDIAGDEFGVFTDDCFTLDGCYDGKGLGYFQGATNYQALVPTMNVVSNAVIPAGPTVEVKHEGTQSKWKLGNAKPYEENYLFGFVGSFTGITPETEVQNVGGKDRNMVKNIDSITAIATINGTTVEAQVETIWLNDDGSYGFRAQFADFKPTDTYSVSVKFVIVSDGQTYESEVSEATTINAIYTKSVSNGLPAVQPTPAK